MALRKGVGFAIRQSSKLLSPTLTIREHEGKWSFNSESAFASASASYDFVPGVEFNETRLDGEHVKVPSDSLMTRED